MTINAFILRQRTRRPFHSALLMLASGEYYINTNHSCTHLFWEVALRHIYQESRVCRPQQYQTWNWRLSRPGTRTGIHGMTSLRVLVENFSWVAKETVEIKRCKTCGHNNSTTKGRMFHLVLFTCVVYIMHIFTTFSKIKTKAGRKWKIALSLT